MAIMKRIELTISDIRPIDGDTVEAWVEIHREIRMRWRIRLVGIEGGELPTPDGHRSQAALFAAISTRRQHNPRFVGNPDTRDKYGRHIGDIMFDPAELLTCILLATGAYWLKDRTGAERPYNEQTIQL